MVYDTDPTQKSPFMILYKVGFCNYQIIHLSIYIHLLYQISTLICNGLCYA
jgi:hypothetical protein